MKAIILAGGLGTRISEESHLRPKPMIEIGGRPILWHIMKLYSHHGFNDFVVCLGYKGYVVKEYFANYVLHNADLTVDLAKRRDRVPRHQSRALAGDPGGHRRARRMTGGRLKRVARLSRPGRAVLPDLRRRRRRRRPRRRWPPSTRRMAGTPRSPPSRRPAASARWRSTTARCSAFVEKPPGDNGLINGGFFVLQPEVVDRIEGDETLWEQRAARAAWRATAS